MNLRSYRPVIEGRRGLVVAAHPAAAMIGLEVLRAGGNAIDAGVATGLALNVLHAQECSFLGVAPCILYLADSRRVATIDGLGVWPRAVSLDDVRAHHGRMPEGMWRALTPGAADAWFSALERYGTMSFADVAAPAIRLAQDGFPVYPFLEKALDDAPDAYRATPATAEVFFPGGRAPRAGEIFVQKDLAATLRRLADIERAQAHLGRAAALRKARDDVYKGELAAAIVSYCRQQGGLLDAEDLARHEARHEEPVTVRYKGYDVYGTGPWGQGPVFPQALKTLEGFDLAALGHNSAAYIHTVSQALNLAFADREAFIGDPRFVDVPMEAMLSESYLAARRRMIDPDVAWPVMPPAGVPSRAEAVPAGAPVSPRDAKPQSAVAGPKGGGTSYFGVIDAQGNIFSCTPSDGAKTGPIVPGTGLVMSWRGFQSKTDPAHPAVLGPGRRPRLTPAPALVLRDGEPVMALGGHGGDSIPQGTLQVFLNLVAFGLDPQQAVEAPRFYSVNLPWSTWPGAYTPGGLRAEGRIPADVREALQVRGHAITALPDWWEGSALYGVILRTPDTGLLQGGSDPRGGGYAVAF